MRSVAKLGALGFETLFVGHGGPIESDAAARVREFPDQCPLERLMEPGSAACWNPTFRTGAAEPGTVPAARAVVGFDP